MQNLRPGDVITVTEYECMALSGRKRIRDRMENVIVVAVAYPNEVLPKERIEEYYGSELPNKTCRVLSQSPATRIFVKDDEEQVYCISLVEEFLRSGMQTIEVGMKSVPVQTEAPSYLAFLNAFGGQDNSS